MFQPLPLRGWASLCLSLALAPALGQTFAPTAPAESFNVFVSGNLTARSGDTHGPVAAGGDLLLNGQTIFTMNSSGRFPSGNPDASDNYGMVIGGQVQYGSGNVSYVNRGTLRVGNAAGSRLWYTDNNGASTNLKLTASAAGYNSNPALQLQRQQAPGSATQSAGIDFGEAFNELLYRSYQMDTWRNSADAELRKMTVPASNNPHLQLLPGRMNYLNLTTTQLAALNGQGSIIFDNHPAANTTLVINVAFNGTLNFTPPNVGGLNESDGAWIIWNFYGSGTVNINGSNHLVGTVFAPTANVIFNNPNNLNGQVVAQSLVHSGGEIHYYPFLSSLPDIPESDAIILPLRAIELGATLAQNRVDLYWDVTGEEAINHYEVERSADGSRYSVVGSVPSAGDHDEYRYRFSDRLNGAAVAYYRIHVFEQKGQSHYSKVHAVRQPSSGSVSLWPNPVADRLNVSFRAPNGAAVQVRLLGSGGQTLMQQRVDAGGGTVQTSFNGLDRLPPGVYLVEVQDESGARLAVERVLR